MHKKETTSLQIPHFAYEECAWYVHRGFHDSLHLYQDGNIEKVFACNGEAIHIRLSGKKDCLFIEHPPGKEAEALSFVKEWFDLERDLLPFREQAQKQADFRPLFHSFSGLRLIRIPDLFEAISWSIIGQQINLAFAYTLKRRLVHTYGQETEKEGLHLFPSPGLIASLRVDDLKELQFSQRKAEYLIGIARAIAEGRLSASSISKMSSTGEMEKFLCTFRGIGPWSANYVLLRCLGRTDAIPHGDAGLINAYKKLFQMDRKPDATEITGFLNQFPGWQAYVVLYLWRYLAVSDSLRR